MASSEVQLSVGSAYRVWHEPSEVRYYSLLPTPHFPLPRIAGDPLTEACPNPGELAAETTAADLERRVLRALCGENSEAEGREFAGRRLAGYRWCEPVHRVIFEVIMNFSSAARHTLREQLPARLTRRGFPDFDFEPLFDAPRLAPGELEQLIGKLGCGGGL